MRPPVRRGARGGLRPHPQQDRAPHRSVPRRVVFWRVSRATGSWDYWSLVGRLRLACVRRCEDVGSRGLKVVTFRVFGGIPYYNLKEA